MDAHHSCRISIEGELNIYTAAEWREKLLSAFAEGNEVELDLSAVSDIDSAGVQLLIGAKLEADAQHKTFCLLQHSPPVRDLLEFLRLEGFFGDPVVIPATNS